MLFPYVSSNNYSDDDDIDDDDVNDDPLCGKYYHIMIKVDFIVKSRSKFLDLNKIIEAINEIYTINEYTIKSGGLTLFIDSCKFDIVHITGEYLIIDLICLCVRTRDINKSAIEVIKILLNKNIENFITFLYTDISIGDRNKLYIKRYNVIDFL